MGERKQPKPPPSETGEQQVKPMPPPAPPRKHVSLGSAFTDIVRMGMDQYDSGFDDAVTLVKALVARRLNTAQIIEQLEIAQRNRPDIVANAIAKAST